MMEAVMIGRYVPGIGNPWHLTLAQWNATIDRLVDIIEAESPKDGQQAVESHLKFMQRQKRRNRAREQHG